MKPPTKQVIILFKICAELMFITLHFTSVPLPHGVNMQSTSYIIKYNLTCTFIKKFIGHFVMEIIMWYALHENTCVYEIQVESFFIDV
jgi:fucose permease